MISDTPQTIAANCYLKEVHRGVFWIVFERFVIFLWGVEQEPRFTTDYIVMVPIKRVSVLGVASDEPQMCVSMLECSAK